jgi:hypothetical protein
MTPVIGDPLYDGMSTEPVCLIKSVTYDSDPGLATTSAIRRELAAPTQYCNGEITTIFLISSMDFHNRQKFLCNEAEIVLDSILKLGYS